MLTPTDIHLLVGLLTQASSPENVAVELGSLVYDVAAAKLRDVDVTVRCPVNGIEQLRGLEVKKHAQPLDVTHVEQLLAKLNDMPTLKARQVVSASGYTSGALKKAAAHNLELFRLTDWEEKYSFEHAQLQNMGSFCSRTLEYVDGPHLDIELDAGGGAFATANAASIQVTDVRGEAHPWGVTFAEFKTNLIANTTNELQRNEEISDLQAESPKPVDVSIDLADDSHLRLGDVIARIKGARLRGVVQWKETPHTAEYKVLVHEDTDKPVVGCVLAELPTGNLIGITVSTVDRVVRLINVAVSMRNLSVIRELQLGRG